MFCVRMYVMSTPLGITRLHYVAMKGCCRHLKLSSLTYFAANLSLVLQYMSYINVNWLFFLHTGTIFVCSTLTTATFKLFIYTHLAECLFI